MNLSMHNRLVNLQNEEVTRRGNRYTLGRLLLAAVRTWMDLRSGRLIVARKAQGYIAHTKTALGENESPISGYRTN